jgi:hypothetical protein
LVFYQTFPVGHSVNDRQSILKSTGKLYDHNESWYEVALDKALRKAKKDAVSIELVTYQKKNDVVILNALDYLYGHVLLKLYNAQYHLDHHRDLGLIIIIPRSFEWLIPKGCAEAWIVDLKLKDFTHAYDAIEKFVSNQFQRFDKIFLSRAYSHPDYVHIDITRFTGVSPFDLTLFSRQKPAITFVLREDRWWMTSILDYLLYRGCRKLKLLSWGSRILSRRQNKKVEKTIKFLDKRLNAVDFFVVGLGRTGGFGPRVLDIRKSEVTSSIERYWCSIYARSHVVVGVHGSNMLLPTALAAGCVEILPDDRYGNIVQDISVRYNDRKQLFFYRFANQYESPKSVAIKVASIIENFDDFDRNMCKNIYQDRISVPAPEFTWFSSELKTEHS